MRYPDRIDSPYIPHDVYTRDMATEAVDIASEILKFRQEMRLLSLCDPNQRFLGLIVLLHLLNILFFSYFYSRFLF